METGKENVVDSSTRASSAGEITIGVTEVVVYGSSAELKLRKKKSFLNLRWMIGL